MKTLILSLLLIGTTATAETFTCEEVKSDGPFMIKCESLSTICYLIVTGISCFPKTK